MVADFGTRMNRFSQQDGVSKNAQSLPMIQLISHQLLGNHYLMFLVEYMEQSKFSITASQFINN